MRQIIRKISKIVDEMTAYLLCIGATDINIQIENNQQDFKISIRSNYGKNQKLRIEDMIRDLNTPRTEEIEGCYGDLVGGCNLGGELHLVGMMVDKAEIKNIDSILEIILYKKK